MSIYPNDSRSSFGEHPKFRCKPKLENLFKKPLLT